MTASGTAPSTTPPRTLTQMLRDRDDAAIIRLLEVRPDLAVPPPSDFSQIASRATTRHSVGEALQLLTTFELWVAAQACTQHGAFTAADLVVDEVDPASVDRAVEHLLELSLLWGNLSSLRPVRAMASMLPDVGSTPPPARPPLPSDPARQSPQLVDKVAAGSAFEFVRRMDVLVEHCNHQLTKLVRSGGMATRDVRALSGLLDVPTSVTTAHLEIARAAGLLGVAVRGGDEVLLPTADYDAWQELPLAQQWELLVRAWLTAHSQSGPEWLKRLCLEAFGDPEDGTVLSLPELRSWLAWQRPRRHTSADREMATMLEQSAWLGITALGARSSFLSEDAQAVHGSRLTDHLPPRVEHVVVQADLTAIAPGPLTPDAARDLGALADVESRGGATVYRFSPQSLQRAQRLGWSSDDILQTLGQRSTTPLPQPLVYLVQELNRSTARPSGLAGGYEFPPRRRAERAPRTTPDVAGGETRLDAEALAAILAALRHDEPAGTGSSGRLSDTVFDSPLRTLREAIETGEPVWFGLVDTHGMSTERVVRAHSVDDGRLTATDVKTSEQVTVPVHRITAAHIMRPSR